MYLIYVRNRLGNNNIHNCALLLYIKYNNSICKSPLNINMLYSSKTTKVLEKLKKKNFALPKVYRYLP